MHMNTPKKRGRPKSLATLEIEGIDKMLSEVVPYLKLTPEQAKEQDAIFKSHRDYLSDLYANFSPTISHNVIEAFASLNDESMNGYQKEILKKWTQAHKALEYGQITGAKETAKKATERAQVVWDKNTDLIKLMHSRKLSINSAADLILKNWSSRGDGQSQPTKRTIWNWLKKINHQ